MDEAYRKTRLARTKAAVQSRKNSHKKEGSEKKTPAKKTDSSK